MVPWYPDDDGDGFGDSDRPAEIACQAPFDHVGNNHDCDDFDRATNPAADEQCNNKDDDCDDLIDEGSPLNSSCGDCAFVPSNDTSRYFAVCDTKLLWGPAAGACMQNFGADAKLARIDNAIDQANLEALIDDDDHWIGLSDTDQDDVWEWHDGSIAFMNNAPVGFNGWRIGQPEPDDAAYCGELDGNGGWADATCTQSQRYICEYPN